MTSKQHNIIHIGMFIGIVILFVVCCFKCCSYKPIEGGTEVKKDTFYIHHTDTVLKDTIIYKWKKVKDTVYLPKDTQLLVEQKCYEDSLSTIWISGIESDIDSIEYRIPRDTFRIQTEITNTVIEEIRSGWGITIGFYAGYGGYVDNRQVKLSPEIGIGGTIGWTYIFKNRKKRK